MVHICLMMELGETPEFWWHGSVQETSQSLKHVPRGEPPFARRSSGIYRQEWVSICEAAAGEKNVIRMTNLLMKNRALFGGFCTIDHFNNVFLHFKSSMRKTNFLLWKSKKIPSSGWMAGLGAFSFSPLFFFPHSNEKRHPSKRQERHPTKLTAWHTWPQGFKSIWTQPPSLTFWDRWPPSSTRIWGPKCTPFGRESLSCRPCARVASLMSCREDTGLRHRAACWGLKLREGCVSVLTPVWSASSCSSHLLTVPHLLSPISSLSCTPMLLSPPGTRLTSFSLSMFIFIFSSTPLSTFEKRPWLEKPWGANLKSKWKLLLYWVLFY